MKENEDVEFAQIMAIMQEVFVPNKPISTEKTQLYFSYLKEYSLKDVAYACEQILRTKTISTFPLPAEIESRLKLSEEESIDFRALEAWGKACDLIVLGTRSTGDEILDETIRIAFGGWEKFGQTDPEQESFDRRHFIDCYKVVQKRMTQYGRQLDERKSILKELLMTKEKIKKLGGRHGN